MTLIPNTPTTIGSWALLIAKAIESYGLDSKEMFLQAHIDLDAIQNNTREKNGRVMAACGT